MESIEKFKGFKLNSTHLIFGGEGTSGSGCCSTNQSYNGKELCPGGDTDHQKWTFTDECDGGDRVITMDENIYDGSC